MTAWQAILVLSLLVSGGVLGSAAPNTPWAEGAQKGASEHLIFVREFSSAHDVKRGLSPVLNRGLDIIAGPKEDLPATDILQKPYAVTTDAAHRVFVTDLSAGVVHVFDFVHSKYSNLHGGDRLSAPVGVAADGDGNVYVSDSNVRAILVYDSKGKFTHYLKSARRRESYFDVPRGIAVDATTGHIYVCDAPRHMVVMLDKKGHVLARWGKRGGGTGPGEFKYPTQVATAGDEMVILDSRNYRVQIFDLRGHFRMEIRLGDAATHASLAMDNDKNIYVTDPQLDRLQVFDHNGQLSYEFGQIGTEPGQFHGISGIWVDSGHCLYIVDSYNKRVELFHISGPGRDACS